MRVFKSGFSPELRTGNVVSSSNTTTVNVAMYIPGWVTGRVTGADGITPLVGAAVTVYDGPMPKGTTNTNGTGDYTVSNLHPGAVIVQAANVGSRTQEQTAAIVEDTATTRNFTLQAAPAGPVLYAYDELGRLVQVTDPSGESAIYRYDAVGNITAIERPGANTVAISDVTPNAGPVGTPVTISGAGFSTTPSQNIVTFNGTDASVTSASAQIVTAVPPNATDGSVTVTIGSSTGPSTTPFDVTTPTTPTVTGFTPTTAASGTAVTVNGTNFDTVPTNDTLRVNLSPAQVTSATTTALQTTVPPSATTGKVSVATLHGTGASTDYLWIAPPPYTATQIDSTGAVTFATSVNVATPANTIALRAVEGTEGHRVAIDVTGVNGSIGVTADVKVYSPFGVVIASAINVMTTGFVDTVTLRWTGTYTIVFDPHGNTLTGTLVVYDVPADVSGPITFGAAVPVTTSVPGQNARLTFTGTAGHRVSLDQSGFTCFTSWTKILTPSGTTLAEGCGGAFIGPTPALPVDGPYTVLIDPKDANYGSTTVTLYDVPADLTGSLTINDPAVLVSLQTPGQIARYTFAGANQQAVTVHMTNNTVAGTFPCLTVTLVRQDGTTELTANSSCGASFDVAYTLPASETYTVKIDPVGNSKGTVSVRVSSP